jgi:hypothetical protein
VRIPALLTALALAATACAGAEPAVAPSPTVTATPAPAPTDTEDEGAEEPDPAALFDQDVCDAILEGLQGERDDLARYATPGVVAELDGPPETWAEADSTFVDSACELAVGDVTFVLLLNGDGIVGFNAVHVDVLGPDAGGNDLQAAIASDVAAVRGTLCTDPDPARGEGMDHETYVLGDGLIVVAVRCFSGNTQSTYVLQRYEEAGGLRPLDTVEQYDGGLVESDEVVGFFVLDDEGRLQAVTLDRGAGDCGRVQTWFVDGDGLRLAQAEVQTCEQSDGTSYEDGWPVVYPSGD